MRRYERIMRAIDRGLTDEELAERFDLKTQSRTQAVACMHVYRMVHDGTLPKYDGLCEQHGRPSGYAEAIAMRLQRIYGRGQW